MSDPDPTTRPADDTVTPEGDLPLEDEMMRAQLRSRLFPSQEASAVKIGRFTMLERIGSGGMGVVYAAYDSELDRKVAIKLLHTDKQAGSEGRSRLLREAQAMAKLAHPNVCTVHEVGTFEGRVYIAMEFIRGKTLGEWRKEKERTWRETLDVFLQAGRGLAAAHAAGVVHRDFKPDNVIVGDDDRVRVLDFGLARPAEVEDIERSYMLPPSDAGKKELDTPLTLTGAVLGTPAYMSPEQHEGKQADERSDQFSFCVALYEGLYGERPYAGETRPELVTSVLSGAVREAPRGTKVPTFLRKVVLRGLATKPGDRNASVQELLRELQKDPARTKRRLMVAAAAVAVVGLGGWGIYSAQQASALQCTGAEDKLAGVWDDTRKHQVREALLATGRPYAEDTWTRVEKRLDTYTQGWVQMHTDACEATYVRGEQSGQLLDLRMACLGSRLTDLRALVDVLAEADADVLDKSIQAAANLKLLDRCADADALAAAIPPPDDPEVAAKVEKQREKLARAKALKDAGKYTEGLALAQEVLDTAGTLDYLPLVAEAQLRVGVLQAEEVDFEASEKSLAEAYWIALGAKHDEALAEAATQLVDVDVAREQPEAALRWGRHARAAVERVGLGGVEEARLLSNLGSMLAQQGEHDEARVHHDRALALFEKALGPDHPEVARALLSGGGALRSADKRDEARAYFERAVAISEQASGPEHPDVGLGLTDLGSLLVEQGEHERACPYLERALAIYGKLLRPDHPRVLAALSFLAYALQEQGRFDEARERYERALAKLERTVGPDHPEVAMALLLASRALQREARYDEARAHLERAVAIGLGGKPGADDRDPVEPLDDLAQLLLRQGEDDEAVRHLERALAIREQHDVPPHDLAETRFAMASALWETGKDKKRAVELAEQAHDEYEKAGTQYEDELKEVHAWLRKHGGKK
jgi:tetratricopeptide (TPR) repeat protein/predicted Ser/Thr protein kinase